MERWTAQGLNMNAALTHAENMLDAVKLTGNADKIAKAQAILDRVRSIVTR